MSCEITRIRLSENCATSTDKITHIKTNDGKVESVAEVAHFIDNVPIEYYYTDSSNQRVTVEIGSHFGRKPIIKSKSCFKILDNLLNLPRF